MDIFNSLIKKEANISAGDEHVARNMLLVMQSPTLQEIGSGF
jgi:hypothetical protein